MELFKCIYHKDDVIYIQMDIITICNQHCWYCYARPESDPSAKWGRIMSLDKAKKMLDAMKNIKYKIVLSILGGEPTLHPELNKIVEYASNVKNIIKIEVFTNGRKPLKLKKVPKLTVNFSFHPSQTDGKQILENTKYLMNLEIPFAITCLYERDSDNFYNFMNELEKRNLINFANIGIVDSHIKSRPLHVKIPDNKLFHKANERIFERNSKLYTLNEIRDQKLNDFYGWKCYKRCLRVLVDGTVYIVGGDNVGLSYDEFKNYTVRVDICSGHCCNDDNNLLYNLKVKE